jgi:hypothetical protein
MYTRTLRFQAITRKATRTGKCTVCGKAATRGTSFFQTLNPWNKHPDGSVKSARDIGRELQAEADAWSAGQPTHVKCESTEDGGR